MRLLFPQEIEVFYLIPAIRKEFAIHLRNSGVDQRGISKLLGVTESAVSQYFNNKRASELKLDEAIIKEIKSCIHQIKEPFDSVKQTQRILHLIRSSKLICKYHRKFIEGIPKNCKACFKD